MLVSFYRMSFFKYLENYLNIYQCHFLGVFSRGLDVHPQTLSRFAAQGDTSSVKILEVIYADEITHVAAGLRWFTYICSKEEQVRIITTETSATFPKFGSAWLYYIHTNSSFKPDVSIMAQ